MKIVHFSDNFEAKRSTHKFILVLNVKQQIKYDKILNNVNADTSM